MELTAQPLTRLDLSGVQRQIMKFGQQPVNLQAGAYYNVERPDYASRWQVRLQMQFLFPK